MVEVNAENYRKQCEITERIDALLEAIDADTAYSSRMSDTLEHPAYAELVGMGDKIIPYLFHLATQHGAAWVHFALFAELSKENPIPEKDRGRFDRTLMHWLKWYTEKYDDVDVYYGLV
jgi:hypothetical protein